LTVAPAALELVDMELAEVEDPELQHRRLIQVVVAVERQVEQHMVVVMEVVV
jgi:hypothetical protein